MKVRAVQADTRVEKLLPGFTFSDAYCTRGVGPDLSARQAALAIFDSPPAWVNGLMSARNWIVGWFGLKAGEHASTQHGKSHVGIFPVLSESPQEILLGLNDRHLDFLLAVTLEPDTVNTRQVTVTTVVKTHNRLGRVYLKTILPFHRLIARYMISRAALPGARA